MKVSLHPAQAVVKSLRLWGAGRSRRYDAFIEPLAFSPFREVRVPSWVKRIGLSFDFPMSPYRGLASIDQPLVCRLIWRSPCAMERRKGPSSSARRVIVSRPHPAGTLVWMSAAAPAPQFAPYLKIHSVKCMRSEERRVGKECKTM